MMKETYLVASLAVSVLACAGCAVDSGRGTGPTHADHSSPKAIMASFHRALQQKDDATIRECMEPDVREHCDKILRLGKTFNEKADEAARLIEERIGKEEAEFFRNIRENGFGGSPLHDVARDGEIDWSRVRIETRGDRAEVFIEGRKMKVCIVKRVLDGWYMTSQYEGSIFPGTSPEDKMRMAEWIHGATERARMFCRYVADGSVNKKNFYNVVKEGGMDYTALENGMDVNGDKRFQWRSKILRFVVVGPNSQYYEIDELGGATALDGYKAVGVETFVTAPMRGRIPARFPASVQQAIVKHLAETKMFSAVTAGAPPAGGLAIRGRFMNFSPGGYDPRAVGGRLNALVNAQIEMVDTGSGIAIVRGMVKSALRPGAKEKEEELANGVAKAVKGLLEAHMTKPE